ncbi:glycerophosphodiester phosphodiesterase [Neisseriaceae bacterium TC5R-5]|nr:glycerophosphodiester phosphodiesterase [Neisseriaceae bacterium TC5R-5]
MITFGSRSPWPYPKLIAHRGGGLLAPENTLAGFRQAVQHGYHAAECDVKLSADNICILLHDDNVERTSNGHGSACHLSMAAISELDAGSWHSAFYAGEQIPTLAAVADYCLNHKLLLNIEIKPSPGRSEQTGRLIASEAQRLWQHSPILPLLSSFDYAALQASREVAAMLPRAYLSEKIPSNWLQLLSELGCQALHCDHRFLTQIQAQSIKAAGYQLLCYTVNDPADAERLWDWGVDSICTDRIDLLQTADTDQTPKLST